MSEDNVHNLPPRQAPPALFIGPFSRWEVVVEGRQMPLLTGVRDADGSYWIVVDNRFGCGPFPTEAIAYQAALCAGQAMAVTAGYPHLGADTKEQPFAPRVSEIDLGHN